jgi:Cu/Zn superoxide dismutase
VLDAHRLVRSRTAVKNVVLALVVGLVIAACGGGGTAAPASPNPTTFAMTAQGGSGVSGTGTIVKGNGSFTLTTKLTGMPPNSMHVSHVHAGGCAHPGGIVYNLQSVAASSSGAATTTSTVPAGYLVPASGWYVNVHFGPDFTEAEYAPSISCGDLQAA